MSLIVAVPAGFGTLQCSRVGHDDNFHKGRSRVYLDERSVNNSAGVKTWFEGKEIFGG